MKHELQEENEELKLSLEKLTEENIELKQQFNNFQKSMNETIEIVNKHELLKRPKTCSELYKVQPMMISGTYTLFPLNFNPLSVHCEVSNNTG